MYLFKSHIQIALLSLGPQVLNCKFSHLLCQLSIDCSGCSFSVIFDCELVYWRVFFSWGSCICFGLWRSLHRVSWMALKDPTESHGSEYFVVFVVVVIYQSSVSILFQSVDLGPRHLLLRLEILNWCSGGPLSLMV